MKKSMVLRFRDFVENTIDQHKEINKKEGYVWWGWWSKPDENLPIEFFSELLVSLKKEKGEEIEIFLIDSGNYILYNCKLLDIKFNRDNKVIPCPEEEKSPGYYCHSEYYAWFKIKDIEKIEQERISNFSYFEIDSFVSDPTNKKFDNKRVFDIYEMLNRRHRTIYFITPYDSEKHKSHKVELVYAIDDIKNIDTKDNGKIEVVPPSQSEAFITTPMFRDSVYIIHLSDLHFNHKHHNFPHEESRGSYPLFGLIYRDILEVCKKDPALLIVSGDLTWHGLENEFDMAYKFLDDLNSGLGLRPEHSIIIPGNHDIQWIDQESEDYIRDKKIENSAEKAEKNYREFIKKYYRFEPNEFFSMGKRIILENYTSIDLIALNSCMLEEEHFCGYGYIGVQQLDKAINNMRWKDDKYKTDYRFLIMHHHLLAAEPSEEIIKDNPAYSITLDSGHISHNALQMQIDLVLHGHRHQPFIASFTRPTKYNDFPSSRSIGIHGAGSAGVARRYLGEIGKNSYSIYKIQRDSIEVKIRATSEAETGFNKEWDMIFKHNPGGGMIPT